MAMNMLPIDRSGGKIMSEGFAIYTARLTMFVLLLTATAAWAAPADSAEASSLFKSKCAACHGPDGAGTAAGRSLNVADLRSPKVQGQSTAQLEAIVKNGKNNMPAFSDGLSDAQIAALVAHIRTFAKKSGSPAGR
jgi:cytochrome c6